MMVNDNLVAGIPTPLKNVSSSVGMMKKSQLYGKRKHVPVTTNQTHLIEKNKKPDKKSYCWQTIITYPSMIPWETYALQK